MKKQKAVLLVTGDIIPITGTAYLRIVKRLKALKIISIDSRDVESGDQSYVISSSVAMIIGDLERYKKNLGLSEEEQLPEPPAPEKLGTDNKDAITDEDGDTEKPSKDEKTSEDDNEEEDLDDVDEETQEEKDAAVLKAAEDQKNAEDPVLVFGTTKEKVKKEIKKIMGKSLPHVTRKNLLEKLEVKDEKQTRNKLMVDLFTKLKTFSG